MHGCRRRAAPTSPPSRRARLAQLLLGPPSLQDPHLLSAAPSARYLVGLRHSGKGRRGLGRPHLALGSCLGPRGCRRHRGEPRAQGPTDGAPRRATAASPSTWMPAPARPKLLGQRLCGCVPCLWVCRHDPSWTTRFARACPCCTVSRLAARGPGSSGRDQTPVQAAGGPRGEPPGRGTRRSTPPTAPGDLGSRALASAQSGPRAPQHHGGSLTRTLPLLTRSRTKRPAPADLRARLWRRASPQPGQGPTACCSRPAQEVSPLSPYQAVTLR